MRARGAVQRVFINYLTSTSAPASSFISLPAEIGGGVRRTLSGIGGDRLYPRRPSRQVTLRVAPHGSRIPPRRGRSEGSRGRRDFDIQR